MFGSISVGDGTAAAPSITFSSDTNTGMYRNGSDQIGFAVAGAAALLIYASNLYVNSHSALSTVSIGLRGQPADGATAISCKIGSTNVLATAGAKICSFYNDSFSTEKAYVDKDGIIVGSFHQTSTAPTANSTGTVVIVAKDAAALTPNAGWLPFKTNAGTTVYVPYWT